MEISASANRSFALHIRTRLNLPFSVDSHVLPLCILLLPSSHLSHQPPPTWLLYLMALGDGPVLALNRRCIMHLPGRVSHSVSSVSWDRVETDPSNFTIVLTNQVGLNVKLYVFTNSQIQNRALFPQDQILVAQQDGVSTDTVSCNPPSAGWVLGTSFRINLVKSSEDQSTIYAQSNEFEIKLPNGVTTSSGSLSIRPGP